MKYLRPACLALAFVATAVAGERADFAHARRTHHHLSHHHTASTSTRFAVVPTPVVRERAADPQQQSQHDKALQTPSSQMGKEEQSSHAPSADPPPANAVFVNGALAVPGAPANTDTVPAKFSAKNTADDELITVAYAFKTLTDEQRRAIYQALKDQPSSTFNADVGIEVPPGIELRPVPNEVAARVPQTKGYRYAVANDRVLLVGTSRIVVGVFGEYQ